ncbi:MAG: hypothetical protein IJQ59_01690 [Bacteroidaceae bacterium]|nr:hypothetical protein [Bacteroidaceae bacterium]
MKRKDVDSQDDVRLVVTNLEEDVLMKEDVNEVSDADETSAAEAVPDDIPVAVTEESEREATRSGWRLFSSEDLPQVSLREILGGDYLLGSYLRRNIWFILLLVLLSILYISNRYAAQQEIIEEEKLRQELVEKKNYALTQYAALTMASRQSSIERKLRQLGDSLLMSATEPPFIIRVRKK